MTTPFLGTTLRVRGGHTAALAHRVVYVSFASSPVLPTLPGDSIPAFRRTWTATVVLAVALPNSRR